MVDSMKPKADLFIHDAGEIITCCSTKADILGRIPKGGVVVAGDKILAVGLCSALEKEFDLSSARRINAQGKVVAPGFVDCHTHLVFGGSRAREYCLKMTQSTAQIEASGLKTGIPASIMMTRQASGDELFKGAMDRLERMLENGTTTVESKSGYGICREDELKQLNVNARLAVSQPVDIVSTFLGAHDFPPEIDRKNAVARSRYIDFLIKEMIPQVAEKGLAEFCDIYCDTGYYTREEACRILLAGMDNHLKPKIHTDAYYNVGGSSLAAELPAISADHLNYTSTDEMRKLAKAGVVGVVLPALDFAVAHPRPFDARSMIAQGMSLALGTNLNPGNWTESMQFVMQLACRNHGMSPEQAMFAGTCGSARALCRQESLGCLAPGYMADIQIWDLENFDHLIYRLGSNAVSMVIKFGKIVVEKKQRFP